MRPLLARDMVRASRQLTPVPAGVDLSETSQCPTRRFRVAPLGPCHAHVFDVLAPAAGLARATPHLLGDLNGASVPADGASNAVEYGSVTDEVGFKSLVAVDALSHVRDGVAYPAVMLTTGANDARVPPWQPGKMTARLQAATASDRPVILRVDYDAGHGSVGATRGQRDAVVADQLAFFYWQIGRAGFQPPP